MTAKQYWEDPTQHATGKTLSLYFILQDLRTRYNEYGKSVPFNQPFLIASYSLLTQFLNTEALACSACSVFLKNTVFLYASQAYLRTQYFDSFPQIFFISSRISMLLISSILFNRTL